MLPSNSYVAAFTSNAILRTLAMTSPQRILLSNPNKDAEQIKLVATRELDNVVVDSLEEIDTILEGSDRNSRGASGLIWQFDETDAKDANISLHLIRGLGVRLAGTNKINSGLKFVDQAASDVKFVKEMLDLAKHYDHNIQKVYFEARQSQANQLQPLIKEFSSNIVVEIKDIDVRGDLLCAAQVMANRDNRLHFNDNAEEYMSKQTRFSLNKLYSKAKVGDWVTFTPAHVLGLESQADKIIEVGASNGRNSGSFTSLPV